MIWKSSYAATGAAGFLVLAALCALLGEMTQAMLLWIVAAVCGLVYMYGPADSCDGEEDEN